MDKTGIITTSKGKIYFSDVADEKAKLNDIVSDLLRYSENMKIIFRLAMQKLIAIEDSIFTGEGTDFLKERGYITKVKIDTSFGKGEFFTLTTKGWLCFKRKSILEKLKKQCDVLAVPEGLTFAPATWDFNSFCEVMTLQKYYVEEEVNDYLIFTFPQNRQMLFGCEVSDSLKVKYTCAAIFASEPDESKVNMVHEICDSKEVEELTIIVPSESKASLLKTKMRKSKALRNKLHYIVKKELNEQTIKGFDELPDLPVDNENTEEVGEMTVDIEKLFQEFNEYADSSKLVLQDMLSVVAAGRVPEQQRVDELDESIENLRKKYTSVYQAALEQIPEADMPEKNLPAAEYVDAVRKCAAIEYKKKLEEVRSRLEDFISVRSLIERYASALAPYQEKARELMGKLEADIELESVSEELAGPVVFLKAIACDDFDSDENYELLEQIRAYYPIKVQTGVIAQKYFIDTDNKEYSETDGDSMDITEEISGESAPESSGMEECAITLEPEIAVKPDVELEVELETELQTELETEENTEADSIQMQESEFVSVLKRNEAFINPGENIGIFSSDISPLEDKKITSSVFHNDMRKGNETAEKIIIREVCKKSYITSQLLTSVKGIPEHIVNSTLEYLLRKGYLRRYKMMPGGEFYCASSKLMKALTHKEVSKFVGVRQRSVEEWGDQIEDKNTSIAARIAYVRLQEESEKWLHNLKVYEYSQKMCALTEAFLEKYYVKGSPDKGIMFLGAFWDNAEECDEFLTMTDKCLSEGMPATRIVFAGINVDKASALADSLLEMLDIPCENLYLYSLSDDCYYTFLHEEKVDKTDIFRIPETADESDEQVDDDELEVVEESDNTNGQEEINESDENDEPAGAEEAEVNEELEEADKPDQSEEKITTVKKEHSFKSPETSSKSTVEMAKGNTEENSSNVSNVYENILKMTADKKFYAATAYAKANAALNPDNRILYNQLSHAFHDPMGQCNYSTENAFNLISTHNSVFEDALIVSTAIRLFFSNQIRFDYNIKPFYNGIKDYAVLNRFSALSKITYTLMDFKDKQKKGMDAYAGYRAKSQSELEREVNKIRQEAASFYNNFVIGKRKETAKSRRFLETKKLMFSVNSDIGQYIKTIVDGDNDMQPLVLDFLHNNFYKEDAMVSEDTIDDGRLWNYIDYFWDLAGDNMVYRRHEKLMSQFRSNIISTTMKAVQLLAKWCNLVEIINNQTEDEGTVVYKKLRMPLLENLEKALLELDAADEGSLEERAGLQVIRYTLGEVKTYIDGTYSEETRKYFYVPFLLTDDVMLDEKFIPDLDVHSSTVQSIQPEHRILEHICKLTKVEKSFDERLSEILEEQGDDYGSARLITEYLDDQKIPYQQENVSEIIESGECFAKENAEVRKNDFIGELELAQSYGQIDNSNEDKKEKILQIVNGWYEWAVLTGNYGFFKKVLDCYIQEIRETAKTREKDLLEQLNGFKETTVAGLTASAKEKRIALIQKMIQEQNYTVAEDLLARASIAEDENEELHEDDFLKEFLDNYDDYYQPVATHKANFASLVNSRTRNKEERGAKRLADNWLPGGSSLGKERLKNLLTYLGFNIDSVKPQTAIGKFENFVVMTARATNGLRNNYTHPIAAFGSGASEAGFRVVCINGAYDADGLIDVMKQIGNAKHTLILFDYALSKSERRRLARKSKNALGDKMFGVIDRTIMMFLVRNYDETRINRMLISLITPFGYYQPYVWESANVMPPEIFMGRKHELERIKSATGANIVYGGRQLGKSALLKKAKEDIDFDENGDRAVYVEIKGLNYEEAATKIGHELYDQFILDEDIETRDWSELARAVKKRLQSQENKIPYLLLLMDEADAFIESCEAVNYKPLDVLKEIQNIGVGRFKFVIAGLRNIVRLKREVALGNNCVLTHLDSMTVKPFNTSEARELLEIPLHYLGLRFPKEKESLITLILATTNYFPGLIQMYCAKLIDAMRNKDYAGYNEADTPIYEVSEKHIKKVLADPEFTQQIREKYVITLKLDEDNYYYLIALLMAYLYHNNGYNDGYSATDIKTAGADYGISKIADLDDAKLAAFMEELKDLNVLRNTDETHYLFTRFTFFQMMGTSADIDDKLEEYMEG